MSDLKLLEYTFFPIFVRKFLQPFSIKDFESECKSIGIKINKNEIEELLEKNPYIFPLEKKMYITRAGAFSGRYFSFVPTLQEVSQKVIIAGDRCLPFVDFDQFPFYLNFSVENKLLEKKILKTDCNTATSLFSLFGDEFLAQYIAADPANEKLHIAENAFELPQNLYLTGFDVTNLFEKYNFKYGDRLICYVSNWDLGIVEIFPLKAFLEKSNDEFVHFSDYEIARNEWYINLENMLLEGFKKMGPCSSIEEQLANVFYENRKKLCIPLCGSIHEFLEKTKKISMELFGVETRLWFTDEDVPADNNGSFDEIVLPFYDIPEFVIDCFVKDKLFELYKGKNSLKEDISPLIIKTILSEEMDLSPDEKDFFTLQIEKRSVKLRKRYNWFADFAFGAFRHRSLELYLKVRELFFELDCSEAELKKLPQAEFVVLSQLFTHITNILQTLCEYGENSDNGEIYDLEEFEAMQLSLDGMEFNLEDIKPILLDAYKEIQKKRFSFI